MGVCEPPNVAMLCFIYHYMFYSPSTFIKQNSLKALTCVIISQQINWTKKQTLKYLKGTTIKYVRTTTKTSWVMLSISHSKYTSEAEFSDRFPIREIWMQKTYRCMKHETKQPLLNTSNDTCSYAHIGCRENISKS